MAARIDKPNTKNMSAAATGSSCSPTNVDLAKERRSATFASEEFACWWAGGEEALRQRRALEQLFLDDPQFDESVHNAHLSHRQLSERSIERAAKFIAKLQQWHAAVAGNGAGSESSPSIQSLYDFRMILSGPLGTALFQQSFPLRLHFSMFLPALLAHATAEQQRQWLPQAWRMQLIGSYAQTELGHGTHLRGLETRADYDASREEFVLNTPTLEAFKWWPGGLGQTANVAIVMAQLYVEGKECGLQAFLVRVRNADTHLPEPGVDVGEIGPKIGLNGVNNGFLGLRNVRIPRQQMLMKHAQVLADGTFVRSKQPLLIYATMMYARVLILRDVSFGLLQAATIATRYSAVRRQSTIDRSQPEVQILDHLTQQAKVLPHIAKGLLFRLASDALWARYQLLQQELDAAGDSGHLGELHSLSCCLKAVCSEEAAFGVELLRRSCGGHGYLASANFGQIYGAAAAACTYEGDNSVLLLQTGRFLLRSFVEALQRKVMPPSVTYLRNLTRLNWSRTDLFGSMLRAVEIAAAEKTRLAFDARRAHKKTATDEVAGNLAGLKLTQAARMHANVFLMHTAHERWKGFRPETATASKMSPALLQVLRELLELFMLELFLDNLADILTASDALKAQHVAHLETRYEETLAALRRNAVAVVDGFDFHDRTLASTLGAWDGRVYERLMEDARRSPLNAEPMNEAIRQHLKVLRSSNL